MPNEIKKLLHRAEPSSRHDTELVFRQLGLLTAVSLVWLLIALSCLTGSADKRNLAGRQRRW